MAKILPLYVCNERPKHSDSTCSSAKPKEDTEETTTKRNFPFRGNTKRHILVKRLKTKNKEKKP